MHRWFTNCLLGIALSVAPGRAADDAGRASLGQPSADLLALSLEDLGNVRVTTVSRKSEPLFGVAAAIHVVTGEDLRRSGVTLLAEALRTVPGLEVARPNARQWAIAARGFNSVFADKLLVQLDGRSLYTPMFSGVFWEETDTVLEDVDRIEVIRGPGATQWGANAVNGVINILTKSAQETQGLLLSSGGGLEERAFGVVRYGGRLGTNAFYRVYGKYSDRDEFTLADGPNVGDSWWLAQEGFRVDWQPSDPNQFTLQGDYYYADLGGMIRRHSLSPPGMFSEIFRGKGEGANLLGRWRHQFSSESELAGQVYYDRTDRRFGIGGEIRDTADVDVQHRFGLGDRHDVVWGVGYRYSVDDLTQTPDFMTRDPKVGLQLFSVFAQDEIALFPDRLRLMLGTKLEHNDYTGFEVQPSGRLSWTPHEQHTLWTAVSRAVRTPARTQRDFMFYGDPPASLPALPWPVLIFGTGDPDFDSERLIAYEAGYRVQLHPRLTLDLAAFYNDYDRLYNIVTLSPELRLSPAGQPYIYQPVTIDNGFCGETYGGEAMATWHLSDAWRLRAGYSLLKMNLHTKRPTPSVTEDEEGNSPQQQVSVRLDADLGRNAEVGLEARYVDALPPTRIPAYTELDARLAWKPTTHFELAVIGRNLLNSHHPEFSPLLFANRRVEVDRAIYAKITLRF